MDRGCHLLGRKEGTRSGLGPVLEEGEEGAREGGGSLRISRLSERAIWTDNRYGYFSNVAVRPSPRFGTGRPRREPSQGRNERRERKIKLSPLVHSFISFVPSFLPSVTAAVATTSSAAAAFSVDGGSSDPERPRASDWRPH